MVLPFGVEPGNRLGRKRMVVKSGRQRKNGLKWSPRKPAAVLGTMQINLWPRGSKPVRGLLAGSSWGDFSLLCSGPWWQMCSSNTCHPDVGHKWDSTTGSPESFKWRMKCLVFAWRGGYYNRPTPRFFFSLRKIFLCTEDTYSVANKTAKLLLLIFSVVKSKRKKGCLKKAISREAQDLN